MASPFFSALLLSIPALVDSCFATPVVNTNPCRWCAEDLISVTAAGLGSKPMDSDVVDRITGACATRTFTCLGPVGSPDIEVNGNGGIIRDMDDGATDGSTTFTATCNTMGTAWISSGVEVNRVECGVGCRRCAENLIEKTMRTAGAKPFTSDIIETTGACLTRTFTCSGLAANIEVNEEEGVVSDPDDGVTDGVAHLTVTCNAAGTAWTGIGIFITRLECSSR